TGGNLMTGRCAVCTRGPPGAQPRVDGRRCAAKRGLKLTLNYTINLIPRRGSSAAGLQTNRTRLEIDYRFRGGCMATRLKRRAHPLCIWLRQMGVSLSELRARGDAPKQGGEDAPDAWLELDPSASAG